MNINRGQRYIVIASIQGYIVFDRLNRVQIGDDLPTMQDAIERRRVLLRQPERV